jgi:hypothetical protein
MMNEELHRRRRHGELGKHICFADGFFAPTQSALRPLLRKSLSQLPKLLKSQTAQVFVTIPIFVSGPLYELKSRNFQSLERGKRSPHPAVIDRRYSLSVRAARGLARHAGKNAGSFVPFNFIAKLHDIPCVRGLSAQIILGYAGTFIRLFPLIFDDADDALWPRAWILRI